MSEIFEQRVNIPLRDIYNDIMNKDNSGIMSEMFLLDAEELILDQMLRDLNLGDGTPATRQAALQKANEHYEQDFSRRISSVKFSMDVIDADGNVPTGIEKDALSDSPSRCVGQFLPRSVSECGGSRVSRCGPGT